MFKGSFWYPNSVSQALLLLAVLLMIPFHQSEIFGLMSTSTVIFGWLPLQLAYDVAYMLVGVGILFIMYQVAPEHESLSQKGSEETQPMDGDQ